MGSPVTAKLLSVPLLKVTSLWVNPVGASEKVNVIVAVPPAFTALTSLVMVKVGGSVSILMLGVLPAPPVFPAASV